MAVDLRESHAATALVEETVSRFGGLDILVTNAGAAEQGSFLELSNEAWASGFGLKMFANPRVIAPMHRVGFTARSSMWMVERPKGSNHYRLKPAWRDRGRPRSDPHP